ncbi:hypothetical protein DVS28_a4141 [Euzebya pacifica]|uniref:Uncharacterized protein n=1 Tax=Euzebya pacifica TaxID=1608957 RepID=A0A346Y2W1_9ACTN|nr:hypothetical protein DVS28_a4141 [Euzebya pacifica]
MGDDSTGGCSPVSSYAATPTNRSGGVRTVPGGAVHQCIGTQADDL